MSKQKSKDKKNQNSIMYISCQTQRSRSFRRTEKRTYLKYVYRKKLEQRLAMITKENIRLIQQCRENKNIYEQKIQQLTIKNQTNEKRLLILSGQKTKFEIQNTQKNTKINLLQKQLSDQQHLRSVELSEYKKNVSFEISKYENQLMQYKQYMNERDELEAERSNLRERIQIEKADKIREVADKQREKVQATDKLRDEMLKKIREMRTNLLSLKKDQLETTTRLTILQNHQLTSELQYQSKQTEKLIFKNEQMQTKISMLERDLQIHKEVEDELAKRSHLSKGMIKKLNVRISELEEEVSDLRRQTLTKTTTQVNDKEKDSMQRKNQLMIEALNNNMDNTEKKYVQLSSRYELLLKDKEDMLIKLQKYDNTSNKLGTVLLKYFTQILQAKIPDVLDVHQEPNLEININHLRTKQVDSWTNSDIQDVVRILLACVKPMISKNNIPIPSIRKNIHLLQEIGNTINLSHSSKNLHALNMQNLKSLSTRNIKLPDGINQNTALKRVSKGKHDILSQDRYRQVIKDKIHELPTGVASKIVTSNLRQWGKTINFTGNKLKRKYRLNQNCR